MTTELEKELDQFFFNTVCRYYIIIFFLFFY